MIWQAFAAVCSLSYAFQNLVVKALTRRKISSVNILWYLFAAAVPVLFLLYQTVISPEIEPMFPVYLVTGVTLNLVAFYGYVRAIELADVSLVAPLLSLSPLFMLFTSWVIVDEVPDGLGLFGVLAIVLGTYFLSRSGDGDGLEPFLKLARSAGVRWALVVSIIWSISANIDKLCVWTSTPLTYAFWFHALFALAFTPVFLVLREDWTGSSGGDPGEDGQFILPLAVLIPVGLLVGGVLQALMSATQMVAIVRTNVTYVIAMKRAGMLVSVLGGGLLFGEDDTARRFFAAVLVFVGLVGIMFR